MKRSYPNSDCWGGGGPGGIFLARGLGAHSLPLLALVVGTCTVGKACMHDGAERDERRPWQEAQDMAGGGGGGE